MKSKHFYFAVLIAAIFLAPEFAKAAVSNNRAMDQFIRGTIASQLDNHYQAVFHFQEALRDDSASAFIHVALAQEYVLLNNPARALEVLEEALDIDPNYLPALELKGLVLRALGRYADARKAIEKLVAADPENVHYKTELLTVHLTDGKFDKVDELYKALPDSGAAFELLTRQILTIYMISDEFTRSIPYMEKLVELDSTDASLTYSLGTLYLQANDTARGTKFVNKAVQLNPVEPRYWYAQAVIAFDRNDLESVVNIAEASVVAAGAYAPMEQLRGNALQRLGRTSEAIDALELAIELDSTSFAPLGTLALLYDQLDSLDEAVELYERAISASDSAPVYLNNLAYTFAERGIELDRARVLVMRALDVEPDNASYLDTMGWIEYQLGNYERAEKWLRQALEAEPRNAPILEHIGDLYFAMNKTAAAKKYYRKALDQDPDNQALRDKIER